MQTVGVFHQKSAAEHALDALRSVGMENSRLAYSDSTTAQMLTDTSQHVSTAGISGGLIGTVLGAFAGLAVSYNVLPGLSNLIVAGPVATALGLTGIAATTVAGAVTGLVLGAIIGIIAGMATARPKRAETDEPDVVVTAETEDPLQAKRIMKEYGADDVRTYEK